MFDLESGRTFEFVRRENWAHGDWETKLADWAFGIFILFDSLLPSKWAEVSNRRKFVLVLYDNRLSNLTAYAIAAQQSMAKVPIGGSAIWTVEAQGLWHGPPESSWQCRSDSAMVL